MTVAIENTHAVDLEHKSKLYNEEKRPKGCCSRFLAWEGCLLTTSIVGVAVGFGIGFALYYFGASKDTLLWVGMPGELFMRMLQAAVLPLVVCTIIAGTAGLKPKENGRVSVVCLTYIIVTNVIGAVIGLLMAIIIKPGSVGSGIDDSTTLDTGHLQTSDLFADLIRNMIPDNLITACFQKSQTGYKTVETVVKTPLNDYSNFTNTNSTNNISIAMENVTSTTTTTLTEYERYVGTAGGTNILGLVIACTAIGIVASQAGDGAQPFVAFFTAAGDIIMRLMKKLVLFTPVGVASLIATSLGRTKNLEETFKGLGYFVMAETLGNAIIILVILPLIFFAFLRRNPIIYLSSVGRSFMAAIGPPSSTLAMPEIITCAETRYGVDSRVSRFAAPFATAINRDGSTMFIVLTCIYIAQLTGKTDVVTIIIITALGAVGSLAIPAVASASVVTVLMIVSSLQIHPANIGIILALEWFSDRIRTGCNACSHVLCCLVTWQLCKRQLMTSSLVVTSEESKPTSDDGSNGVTKNGVETSRL